VTCVDDQGFRRESQPLRPESWVGLEVDPGGVSFLETIEANSAYRRAATAYPKAISLTNRIGIAADLQVTATVLALHMSREFRVGDARLLMLNAHSTAKSLGPLPISLVTVETVPAVCAAIEFAMDDIAVPWVLVDLLRLIEGVRP
jgi:hypothetical protein